MPPALGTMPPSARSRAGAKPAAPRGPRPRPDAHPHHHHYPGARGRTVVAAAVGVCVSAVCLGEASARSSTAARWAPAPAPASGIPSWRGGGAAAAPAAPAAPAAHPPPTFSSPFRRRSHLAAPPRAVAGFLDAGFLDAALGDGWLRDVGAASAAAIGAYFWVKLFDVLASRDVLERKLSRKVIHTTSGPFFVLTWPLFSSSPHASLFAAAVPAIQAARLFAIGSGAIANPDAVRAVSREGGRAELLGGPFIYTLVLVLCTGFFWRDHVEGFAALALMCGGDGLADIVGRRLGRGNPLPWNRDKSVAGSAAMFLGGFGMSLGFVALFHAMGYLDVSAGDAAGRLAVVAAACTAAESLPAAGAVDDNVSVPLVAAALGGALFR